MDNQCDRCGKELPKEVIPEGLNYPDELVTPRSAGYHIVIGGTNFIEPDGSTDWDMDDADEVDLCPECRVEFHKLWRGFYGKG